MLKTEQEKTDLEMTTNLSYPLNNFTYGKKSSTRLQYQLKANT